MITPDGRVKVLDFGLAKAFRDESPAAAVSSESPTLTGEGTRAGVIMGTMGTAPYMSPEQVKGKHVDKRSDIWAFGCVLFEVLTGQRAFGGETVSETLAEVLKAEPDWKALPAGTPHHMQDLVERCLRKDPRRRVRDIGDARITLEEAPATPAIETTRPPAQLSRGWRWMILSLISLLGIATGVAIWSSRRTRTGPRPSRRIARDKRNHWMWIHLVVTRFRGSHRTVGAWL